MVLGVDITQNYKKKKLQLHYEHLPNLAKVGTQLGINFVLPQMDGSEAETILH